jgi:hypothetical protein
MGEWNLPQLVLGFQSIMSDIEPNIYVTDAKQSLEF